MINIIILNYAVNTHLIFSKNLMQSSPRSSATKRPHHHFDSNYLSFNGEWNIHRNCCFTNTCKLRLRFGYWLLDCQTSFIPIPFAKRYVYYLISALLGDKIIEFMEMFNSFNLEFTVGPENKRSIPFIALLVIRVEYNILRTKWCWKPEKQLVHTFFIQPPIEYEVEHGQSLEEQGN